MTRARRRSVVVLDNEAVQALRSAEHPKHRRVIRYVRVIDSRRRRSVGSVDVVVPSSVRVEAGWDRTNASWALANRVGAADVALDERLANSAGTIRTRLGPSVSVVDAHVGAVVQTITHATQVTVITSDPRDVAAVAEGADVVIVSI